MSEIKHPSVHNILIYQLCTSSDCRELYISVETSAQKARPVWYRYSCNVIVMPPHHLAERTMDSRAFRHELLLRILRARHTGRAYEPLRNGTEDLRVCASCQRTAASMKRCGGCRWAKYCDAGCQHRDWPHHKSRCDPDYCLPEGTMGIQLQMRTQGYDAEPTGR